MRPIYSYRITPSLPKWRCSPMYPTDQDGLNSKLHAVCDGQGWLLSEGEMSDHKGAALMIDAFPKSKTLPGDRGWDANWFRAQLPTRQVLTPHDTMFYRPRPQSQTIHS